jgi:hypothetical protein
MLLIDHTQLRLHFQRRSGGDMMQRDASVGSELTHHRAAGAPARLLGPA